MIEPTLLGLLGVCVLFGALLAIGIIVASDLGGWMGDSGRGRE